MLGRRSRSATDRSSRVAGQYRHVQFEHKSATGSISGTVGGSGRQSALLDFWSFGVASWVNMGYYVNMAMSEIRKYLDNFKIRNNGPVAPDIDLAKVPKPQEPAPKTPDEGDLPFTE